MLAGCGPGTDFKTVQKVECRDARAQKCDAAGRCQPVGLGGYVQMRIDFVQKRAGYHAWILPNGAPGIDQVLDDRIEGGVRRFALRDGVMVVRGVDRIEAALAADGKITITESWRDGSRVVVEGSCTEDR